MTPQPSARRRTRERLLFAGDGAELEGMPGLPLDRWRPGSGVRPAPASQGIHLVAHRVDGVAPIE
ncbi:MAG: hypothetical protein ACRD0U_17905, partial [Acidimicrobiales bacterium]